MAETIGIDRTSVAEPVSRPRPRKPATVSASALALHLDCSRSYIGKLEAEGVIHRQGDGFPLDQSRVRAFSMQRTAKKLPAPSRVTAKNVPPPPKRSSFSLTSQLPTNFTSFAIALVTPQKTKPSAATALIISPPNDLRFAGRTGIAVVELQ